MRFELIVLGTSAAAPAYGRHCSGQLLCLERQYFLIDCGEGTQYQLQRAGEGLGRLSHVLISHLHGDHYFGLPGLLTSLALGGRQKELTIVSPPGLRERMIALLEYDRYPPPFPIVFQEIRCTSPTEIFADTRLEVIGFPLDHRIETNGYLIREKPRPANMRKDAIEAYDIPYQRMNEIKAGGDFLTPDGRLIPHAELTTPPPPPRSYAHCSDTRYLPGLTSLLAGVDLLYHEATFLHEELERARETGHTTARQAGQLASACGVGRLLIGHFSARYPNLEPILSEARAEFAATSLARELEHHHIPVLSR